MKMFAVLTTALLFVGLNAFAQPPADSGQPAAPSKDLYEKLRDKEKETVASFKKALEDIRTDSLKKATLTDGKLEQLTAVGQAWTKAVHQAIDDRLASSLEKADVDVLKDEKLGLQSLETLSGQMKKGNADILRQLHESSAAGNPFLEEDSLEKVKAEAKLTEAINTLEKTLAEALETRRFVLVQVARGQAAPAPSLAASAPPLAKAADIQADQEEEFLRLFTTDSGTSPVVRCEWKQDGGNRLDCKPKGLLISGQEVSHIRITGLPPTTPAVVKVISGEETVPVNDNRSKNGFREPLLDAPCPGAGDVSARKRLSCDQLRIADHGGEVLIAIHTNRYIMPSYGSVFSNLTTAEAQLRRSGREKLSLVLTGRALEAVVTVQLEDVSRTTKAGAVPLAYQRWSFETGAFMSVTRLTDQELITVADPNNESNLLVRKIDDADNYRQQTGIFLNFVPQNYRFLGFGVGFSTESNRPLSVYVGPNVRLQSFGSRGLASLSAGMAMIPVRRFPGIEEGDSIGSNSKLLEGKIRYETKPYVLLHLGFSFGPIGGGAK